MLEKLIRKKQKFGNYHFKLPAILAIFNEQCHVTLAMMLDCHWLSNLLKFQPSSHWGQIWILPHFINCTGILTLAATSSRSRPSSCVPCAARSGSSRNEARKNAHQARLVEQIKCLKVVKSWFQKSYSWFAPKKCVVNSWQTFDIFCHRTVILDRIWGSILGPTLSWKNFVKKIEMTHSKLITLVSVFVWTLFRPIEAGGFGDLLSCLGVANNSQVSMAQFFLLDLLIFSLLRLELHS